MDNNVENLVRMIDEAFAQGKVVDFVHGGIVSAGELSGQTNEEHQKKTNEKPCISCRVPSEED